MGKKRFYRSWKRQYLRGLKAVRKQFASCCETGDADAVHELRVAIRRTRLLALIGRAAIGRKRALAFRAWAQHLADALSPVRDYDVMIEWATKVCHDEAVLRGLHRERRAAWRHARKGLKPMSTKDWQALRRLEGGADGRRKLAARYAKITAATREVIEVDAASFDRLNSAHRHDFRRAVRRMKYLQELEERPRQSEQLAKLQAVLGELQNAQVMQGLLRSRQKRSRRNRQLMRSVKRHESHWYPRCRRSIKSVVAAR